MATYSYKLLTAPDSFRLLKLYGEDEPTETLRCELLEFTIKDPPSYEAISYTWDGQTPSQPISCDGKQLLVTKNCESALRHLKPASASEHRLLWIDSLCIDQSSNPTSIAERQRQVRMMGSIYSQATQVLIWLGDGTGTLRHSPAAEVFQISVVFEWLSALSDAASRVKQGEYTNQLLDALAQIDVPCLIDVFVEIPWFKRVWTIQEAALSRRAILIYGQTKVSFQAILQARQVLRGFALTNHRANEVVAALDNGFDIHDRASRCFSRNTLGSSPDAAELLEEARFSLASLEKDKVFAMYGLFAAMDLQLPEPDYSKSTAQIFRETTMAIINSSGNLDVLEQVHGLGPAVDLTSWAPDWSTFKHAIIPIQGRQNCRLATKSSIPKFSFDPTGTRLTIQGLVIEKITSRADVAIAHCHEGLGVPEDYMLWSQNVQPDVSFWRTMLESFPRHSKTILRVWNIHVFQKLAAFALRGCDVEQQDDDFKAFFATLLSREHSWVTAQEDLEGLTRWYDALHGAAKVPQVEQTTWMTRTSRHIRESPELAPLLDTQEFSVWDAMSKSVELSNIHRLIDHVSFYQTIFRTESGKLGMAPYPTHVGDEIALFSGGRLPMVLRCQQDVSGYRLISPAYVHGIMDGSAWPDDGPALQDITLI
ncbi:HET-domain-containing protein [Westerdykella ornata]|uniref:HET-domain-containing protein n=1 Tax=Westerdykella ornata TaxID=318751 RepID=A0A6A6J8F3_WESOR|nr:HET-domain-containing protein [Westerdykella ornata]KAF2272702.1 HET-domain-containing protein [Westerdykella ornata]